MVTIKKIAGICLSVVLALTSVSFSAFAATASADIFVPNLPVWDGTVAESFAGGSGTKDDPYLISNGAQLALLMNDINGAVNETEQATAGEYYKLTNDILLNDISDFYSWSEEDAPANEWTPGGSVENYILRGFAGYFDGNNYDIIGIYVCDETQYNGLFGYIYNGQVKNLGIKYAHVCGTTNTAALAGYVRASSSAVYISGCTVENSLIDSRNNVGAFVGYAESYFEKVIIDRCSVTDTYIEGNNYVGGIAGVAAAYGVNYNNDENYAIEITNCENTYKEDTSSGVSGRIGVGGILGSSKDFVSPVSTVNKIALLIENCICGVSISSADTHTGVIVGTAGPADREDETVVTDIKNCYAYDTIGHEIYGFTLSSTDASTSKLLDGEQMKDKTNFSTYNFEEIWSMLAKSPALRILGDAGNDGKLTAKSFIDAITAVTSSSVYDITNIDFNKDGVHDMSDINSFMAYMRNKGAYGTVSAGNVRIMMNTVKSKTDGNISYVSEVFNPVSPHIETDCTSEFIGNFGDIVALDNGVIGSRVFGNIYQSGSILDFGGTANAGAGYVEVSSYDEATGILKLSGYSEDFIIASDSIITFSDKSMEKFNEEEASVLASTSKAYRQNDDPSNPLRAFVGANKTADGNYKVAFVIIVRD